MVIALSSQSSLLDSNALNTDREKKIPRTGSSSSATGQDKREKDPRGDKIVSSSSDRKPSRDDKESSSNNNISGSRHKEREHDTRSSSRIVEIERPSSRGALEKKDKKEVKEEVRSTTAVVV